MYQLAVYTVLISFFYLSFFSPLIYFLLINPKLKKKIGIKIESQLVLPYPHFIKNYFGLPNEVSMYIGSKYILKILGFNADEIKIGKGTLQKVNYSTKEFSVSEILFSLFNQTVGFLWMFWGIFLLFFKNSGYFSLV